LEANKQLDKALDKMAKMEERWEGTTKARAQQVHDKVKDVMEEHFRW
jgi:DNA polymerase II large subunit